MHGFAIFLSVIIFIIKVILSNYSATTPIPAVELPKRNSDAYCRKLLISNYNYICISDYFLTTLTTINFMIVRSTVMQLGLIL
jgi:hypothetical protein